MKAINIVPRALLPLTINEGAQMSLFQEMIKHDDYTEFFETQSKIFQHHVIMDNGAAEGTNPSIEELIPQYLLSHPTEVVMPDVVGDMTETLKRSIPAIEKVLTMRFTHSPQFKIMAVPQGSTFAEWKICLAEMLKYQVDTIGISKFVTKAFAQEFAPEVNVRLECVKYLMQLCTDLKIRRPAIHLLGCYYTPYEIGAIEAELPGIVRSTDSAIAYVYSRNGLYIDRDERPDQAEIDFSANEIVPSQDGSLTAIQLLDYNMRRYKELCNNQ